MLLWEALLVGSLLGGLLLFIALREGKSAMAGLNSTTSAIRAPGIHSERKKWVTFEPHCTPPSERRQRLEVQEALLQRSTQLWERSDLTERRCEHEERARRRAARKLSSAVEDTKRIIDAILLSRGHSRTDKREDLSGEACGDHEERSEQQQDQPKEEEEEEEDVLVYIQKALKREQDEVSRIEDEIRRIEEENKQLEEELGEESDPEDENVKDENDEKNEHESEEDEKEDAGRERIAVGGDGGDGTGEEEWNHEEGVGTLEDETQMIEEEQRFLEEENRKIEQELREEEEAERRQKQPTRVSTSM